MDKNQATFRVLSLSFDRAEIYPPFVPSPARFPIPELRVTVPGVGRVHAQADARVALQTAAGPLPLFVDAECRR